MNFPGRGRSAVVCAAPSKDRSKGKAPEHQATAEEVCGPGTLCSVHVIYICMFVHVVSAQTLALSHGLAFSDMLLK
jgi:hypothetical protein